MILAPRSIFGLRRKGARGYGSSAAVLSFNHDGLQIARVKRDRASRRYLPMWHFIFLIYMILLIRLISMADIGPAAYALRMEQLENGSALERTAARVMYMDPVSRKIATSIRRGMREFGFL